MPEPALLTRGKVEGQAIANAGNYDFDVMCGGDSTLVVEVDMTATAAPDVTVAVQPYEADGATVMPVAVPKVQEVGPTLSGGHDYYYGQFDVTGIDRARVRITNNNAVPQTITRASWRLA